MASSQKMASLVTKIARTGVVAYPEAKWVPAQVMLSQEPKWVPAEITVPRNSRQDLPPQQDLTVSPLPKERWNSTAATCSSNSIGPLCSDVIEKN